MKNKIKKLQSTIHKFNKKGFLFCAVFALTLQGLTAFIPKLGTYADPTDPEIILEADARIAGPIAGATPDFGISSTDDPKYSVTMDYWYLFEEPYTTHLTEESVFEAHKDYAVRFIFEAREGYAFSEDALFTLNGQPTTQYGSKTDREYIFYDTQEGDAGERINNITYDFNGGTLGGESTITTRQGCYGLEISEDSMVTELGVNAPEGKALNYITIDDEFFNLGDGYFICRDVTIKYFWREDTGVLYAVTFDPNGGTVLDYGVPTEVPEGQTFMFHAPDETQILPPEGKEFDAFEINGVRYEDGAIFTVTEDSYFKILWKDINVPAVPNTGTATSEGCSATSTIFGAIATSTILAGLVFISFNKRRI